MSFVLVVGDMHVHLGGKESRGGGRGARSFPWRESLEKLRDPWQQDRVFCIKPRSGVELFLPSKKKRL